MTSKVTRRLPGGSFGVLSMMRRKCVVSLTYEGMSGMYLLRKWSTSLDVSSEGPPLPDTIGLPGGGMVPLWILGRR